MPPKNLLDRLFAFEPTRFSVVSVYLNTQTDQHGRDNFDSFVRRELKTWAKRRPMRTPECESFERDTAARRATISGARIALAPRLLMAGYERAIA